MDYAYNAPAPASAEEKRAKRERRKKFRGERKKETVFVVYAWSERRMNWLLLGFSRRSTSVVTPKYVEKLRMRFTIPNGVVMRVVELFAAAAVGAGSDPLYATRS